MIYSDKKTRKRYFT